MAEDLTHWAREQTGMVLPCAPERYGMEASFLNARIRCHFRSTVAEAIKALNHKNKNADGRDAAFLLNCASPPVAP
ncbi:hypothetical protein [Novosphingobium sp.]|uniref:hypothetical protein n=1 Tax=Novosphingobium sp. TaxID=1874826 RepID=UPI002FDE631A